MSRYPIGTILLVGPADNCGRYQRISDIPGRSDDCAERWMGACDMIDGSLVNEYERKLQVVLIRWGSGDE